MTYIPDKAQKAADPWKDGSRTIIWTDLSNTGEVRVYVRTWERGPVKRLTGKSIIKLLTDIDKAEGEFTWTYNNAGALSLIRSWTEHLKEQQNVRETDRPISRENPSSPCRPAC